MKALDAERMLLKVRNHLLLDHKWYGYLALNLKPREWQEPYVMATDGTYLYYNAPMVGQYSFRQMLFVNAHEVLHCALGHCWRRGSRDAMLWNIATDLRINYDLVAARIGEMPPGALYDKKYTAEWSADQIYRDLPRQKPQQGQSFDQCLDATDSDSDSDSASDSDGKPKPGKPKAGNGKDQSKDQSQFGTRRLTEADWQQKAEQASRVCGAGTEPGSLGAHQIRLRQSKLDPRSVLEQFIERTMFCDYDWSQPNRRHVSRGLYLPSVHKENTASLAIAVDTSGSVSDAMLGLFGGWIRQIQARCRPERIWVLYCDTRVTSVQEFGPDTPFAFAPQLSRGGTYFQPILESLQDRHIRPEALIWLTDGDNADGRLKRPQYPVLWVLPDDTYSRQNQDFGQLIRLPEDGKQY